MTVFKSNRHVYVQVVDDTTGHTVAAASTSDKENSSLNKSVEDAGKLGESIGKRLKKKKVKTVVFDRNGYPFHGIVKAVADGARKSGIEF
jgi:large subunit ribosomal protein L18